MTTKEKQITEIKKQIADKQKEIDNFELDNDDYIEQYEECLNEQGDISIGSLTYSPANVLKNVDEIAYNCGLNDFVDSIDKEDNEEYKKLLEELETLEDELTDLEIEE